MRVSASDIYVKKGGNICWLGVFLLLLHLNITKTGNMKRLLILFLSVMAVNVVCLAQNDNRMRVILKDGGVADFFVTEVEKVVWDNNSSEGGGDVDPDKPSVTGDATNVTTNSATLTCYANNILDNLSGIEVGVIYCTEGTPSKSNGTRRTVNLYNVESDGKYTVNLTGLNENTTYYYRSYVLQGGLWF